MPAREIELLPESLLREVVDFFVRVVEAAGALIIFLGAVVAIVQFLRVLPRRDPHEFVRVRLTLGRFLALGLEFQLASDILRTAIAPSFEELGMLAVVATIRTALNFFLAREIRLEEGDVEERRRLSAQSGTVAGSPP
ncbi:MAG TPA: DUF1622 domain-containing protein [Nocardioidaceae bacterium]|nr:DUF1622 domain-containing protein [Nocardioidaceae bacterium]